ncbi:MAG: hypothetical protein NZM04_07900 [Methylacidiphilales bacterium]|nr:hypothetical protein [Candidatus Methylacidiphilales bacterium]
MWIYDFYRGHERFQYNFDIEMAWYSFNNDYYEKKFGFVLDSYDYVNRRFFGLISDPPVTFIKRVHKGGILDKLGFKAYDFLHLMSSGSFIYKLDLLAKGEKVGKVVVRRGWDTYMKLKDEHLVEIDLDPALEMLKEGMTDSK